MNPETFTAQQYSTWLVYTMSVTDEGPDFEKLMDEFNHLHERLDYLETCLALPSYETDRRDQPGS